MVGDHPEAHVVLVALVATCAVPATGELLGGAELAGRVSEAAKELADLPSGTTGPFVVGVLASLGTGLVAILWLLDYVRRHTYDLFVVYRIVLGLAVLVLVIAGVLDPLAASATP